jgi:hypothetical protein
MKVYIILTGLVLSIAFCVIAVTLALRKQPATYTPPGAMISCAEVGKGANTCAEGYALGAGKLNGLAVQCHEPSNVTNRFYDHAVTVMQSVARGDADKDKALNVYVAAMIQTRTGVTMSDEACARVKNSLESAIGVPGPQ